MRTNLSLTRTSPLDRLLRLPSPLPFRLQLHRSRYHLESLSAHLKLRRPFNNSSKRQRRPQRLSNNSNKCWRSSNNSST